MSHRTLPQPSVEQEAELRRAKLEIVGAVRDAEIRRRCLVAHVENKLKQVHAPRVLVIEDDSRMAQLLSAVVEQVGNAVVEVCNNGVDAISIACERAIDFFVIDLNLPGVDGITVAETIRTRSRLPLSPILFVSGYIGQPALARIAALAGANGYLHKPVSVSDLKKEVIRLLPTSSGDGGSGPRWPGSGGSAPDGGIPGALP